MGGTKLVPEWIWKAAADFQLTSGGGVGDGTPICSSSALWAKREKEALNPHLLACSSPPHFQTGRAPGALRKGGGGAVTQVDPFPYADLHVSSTGTISDVNLVNVQLAATSFLSLLKTVLTSSPQTMTLQMFA